jgi:uncharacterized protein YkwD
MSKEENYEKLEAELFQMLNDLRKKPKDYLSKLRESLNHFKEKIYCKPDEAPIQTYEGDSAVKEAIQFLMNQKPVQELTLNKDITQACRDHINDIGPKGLTMHEGSDGSDIGERIEKYCEWDGATAENLDFGFKKAENILLNMIICDGVKERFQRMNLFNPEFKFVGIAAGYHKDYGICVCIGYCKHVRPLGSEPTDVSNFIREYIKNSLYKKKINNEFQEDDPNAPDNTVSVKIDKKIKEINGKMKKITKKIYKLSTGAQHIIEIENC